MEIAYCTRLLPHIPNLYKKYPNRKFVVSVDKFIMNQIIGIEEVTDRRVTIVNIPEVPSYPIFPAIVMRKRKWSHADECNDIDIGFPNLPIIRQMIVPHKVEKELKNWVKKYKNEKKIILTYSTNPMSMSPLVKLKKRDKNIRIVLVVGDLIGDKGINISGRSLIKQLLNRYYQKGTKYYSAFDGYILVTEYMAEELGAETKPHIVIEGIYNSSNEMMKKETGLEEENGSTKIVFHAGSLERQFGVFNLIEAFSMIKDNSYRLWLAGGSKEADEIKKCCEDDSRITYYGFISPEEVFELQEQATVVVNPRLAGGEYTKYSFPSKTMEGLASRKPFIGCKLPGIPEEYSDYIQYVEDDSPEALSRKIVEICEMTELERNRIGEKARNYILNEKGCRAQGEKIKRFLETL